MQSADTFPKLLLEHALLRGERPAMREKDLGIWQTWSWSHVAAGVRAMACGLASIGFQRGQRLAVIGDNSARLYQGMAAAHALGGIAVPVYQDASADEILYVFNNAEVHVALVADQEQVDKLLEIRRRCPSLARVIFIDDRGMSAYQEDFLCSYAGLKGSGRIFDEQHPNFYPQQIAQGQGADLAMILHTSGATGRPKGVLLSHDNLIITARNAAQIEGINSFEEVLAYLPMAGSGDIMVSYAQSLVVGYCVSCPESGDTTLTDLREIGPSYFYGPPRVFESLMKTVMLRMQGAGWLRRSLFNFFMALGGRVGLRILDRERVSMVERLLYGLGGWVIYKPLRDNLGLSRVRVAYTGGDAIGPDVFNFFRALGMNLKQVYGQMEVSLFVTMQRDGQIKANSVGTPARDVEIKIDDRGEVLYRGPGAFAGYCNDPEATRAAKDEQGWVRTGDIGFFDGDGHLCIIDRVSDQDRLNDGTLVAPKYIENKLRFSSYIRTAVAFGNGRDYVAVLINIDPLAVGNWAQQRNLWYSGYADLAGKPEVYELIADCVAKVNAELAAEARLGNPHIRHFAILDKELNADDGELTRTRKVRRHFIAQKYAPLIESLYAGGKPKPMTAQGAATAQECRQEPTIDSDAAAQARQGGA